MIGIVIKHVSPRKGVEIMSKYEGKITNHGAQKVESPYKMPKSKPAKIKTGKDLRNKGK